MCETCFDENVGQRVSAVRTCLRRMYSKPGAGHGIIASIGEQFWNPNFTADRQPPTNRGCRFFPQWQATFFSALAVDQNAGLRVKKDVLHPESHQLRDTQSTCKTKVKHCSVTDAAPDSWVRGIQDRLHLLSGEMPDQPGVRLFRRGWPESFESAPAPTVRDIPCSAGKT